MTSSSVDVHGKTYNRILLVIVVMIGSFATVLNQTFLATALPTFMRVFDVSTATVQWLSTGFLLVNGIMIPISAWLADNVPTKRLYLITMLIFFCGTLIAFQAHSFAALLVGRLIQAVGVGVVLPLLQIMMLKIFPANQRGQAMGLAGIVVGLAPAVSPTLAGYILDHGSWRILFGMLLPIIAFVLFGALFFMKDVLPGKPSQLDLWSTITSTLGFGSLLYGFSTAGNDGWGDAKVLIALAVGLVFIALFIHRQLTMERPFLDLRVFLNMGTHLGLTKTTNNNRQTIRPTSTSQGVQLLVYQPLGTTNNERVYVYYGDQKSPLPDKRGLAKTTRVASSVTTTNAKHATLTLTTTKYTYQNQLAKVLFAIPGTKLATTQQVAHFTVPKSWLVLSSKQATRLKQAAANPTNQATLKTQATAYVTAHVQSDLKELAAKAQAGDQAAQAQLANQTQLTQSLAAKYQRAFTRQALLKLSSH